MDTYKTVKGFASAELVEKRSRFIGYIMPVTTSEEALAFLEKVRSTHWDATHNVYAYVLRGEGISRYSDDNEPQGTAGMPTLDVIQKRGLTDCITVVTRYFGGTLLGAGGLVRAYSAAAKAAVEAAGERVMTLCSVCELSCPYTLYGKLPALIAKYGGSVDDSSFTDEVTVRFHIPADGLNAFNKALSEESSGKIQAEEKEQAYMEIK